MAESWHSFLARWWGTQQKKTIPRPRAVIRSYTGRQQAALAEFNAEAKDLARHGYIPTSQVWAPGQYGFGSFVLALLLCIVIIGFLVFLYMLIVKPSGTLTVTFSLQTGQDEITTMHEKTCPQCAESVKAAAKICRYCSHKFEHETLIEPMQS